MSFGDTTQKTYMCFLLNKEMISLVHRMWITTFEEMRKSESKKKIRLTILILNLKPIKKYKFAVP